MYETADAAGVTIAPAFSVSWAKASITACSVGCTSATLSMVLSGTTQEPLLVVVVVDVTNVLVLRVCTTVLVVHVVT